MASPGREPPRSLGESGQLWPELAEPRAEEVTLLDVPMDHPGQGCPVGLTSGSFSPRQLGTRLGRKGGDCVSWQSREESLGDSSQDGHLHLLSM